MNTTKRLTAVLFMILLISSVVLSKATHQPIPEEPLKNITYRSIGPEQQDNIDVAAADVGPSVDRWLLFGRHLNTLFEPASVRPVWLSDGSCFAFITEQAGERSVRLVNPQTGKTTEFIDTDRLRAGLADVLAIDKLEKKGLPFHAFSLMDDTTVRFVYDGNDYLCSLEDYKVKTVSPTILSEKKRAMPKRLRHNWYGMHAYEKPSPDGRWLATEIGNDLALRSTADGNVLRLTNNGAEKHRWDVTTVVWSADGSLLAAAQLDRRNDHYIPVVRWLGQEEQIDWYHYPKNGTRLPLPGYVVINPVTHKRIKLDLTGLETRWIQPMGFRPDNSELILISVAGDASDRKVFAADVKTGKLRLILEDVGGAGLVIDDRFMLNAGAARTSFGASPWAHGKQFLDASDRDGTISLYSYDYDGKQVARITPPGANVETIIAYDAEGGWLYVRYRSRGNRPYDLHLGRARTNGSDFQQLTSATGAHEVVISPSKKYIIDTHSAVNRAQTVELLRANGAHIATLAKSNISRLKAAGWIPPEEFTATAADGQTTLHGTIFFPPGFDPSRKYPVIDSIYNGPQMITLSSGFMGSQSFLADKALSLSQLGFVCIVLESRGTPGRGRAFQEVAYKRVGQYEIPDHVAAIREIAAKRPYMDLDRVGITGYSAGGYMTLRGMLLAPDFYKVGVSGAPVVDLMDTGTFVSWVMGWPWDNPEGYAAGSNLLVAGKLSGHLLIIHGTSDVNVPFSNTMKMVDALFRAGKPVDLLLIPEMDHSRGFNNAVPMGNRSLRHYVNGATARYLVEHLAPEGIDYQEIPLQ